MPVISIIIPCHNVQKYLPRCIDSLLAQSFQDWEAVCVDDGSTDATAAILDAYAARDGRLNVIHQPNAGVSSARNRALKEARGAYVLFVDSDDLLHPQALEICLKLARRDGSDLVCFTYDHAWRTRLIVRHALHLGDPRSIRFPKLGEFESAVTENIFDHATERSGHEDPLATRHCQPWRCLYKKEILEGIDFIPGIIYEDFPWWSRVLLRVKKATLTRLPLYYYYPNPGSYILSSREEYKIRSLVTAIAAAKEAYASAQASVKAKWEENFLRHFEHKLASKRSSVGRTRTKLLLFGHILNPLWDGEQKHRERRCAAFGRILTAYMKRNWLPAALSVKPAPCTETPEEKIFTLWLQGEQQAPPIVQSCFKSIREHCSQDLVVLDAQTLHNYISLPETIEEKYRAGKIKPAHYADICRVELLHTYGGYWLDATCFVTGPIPEFIQKEDFFVYMAGDRVHGNYSYVQNCFIRARKGSYLLEAWRAMILDYWLHEDRRVDYFMHQVMFRTLVNEVPRAREYFDRFPHLDQYPTHLYLYEYKDRPWNPEVFRKATQEGFFYQKTSYRDMEKVVPGSFADYLIRYSKTAPESEPQS